MLRGIVATLLVVTVTGASFPLNKDNLATELAVEGRSAFNNPDVLIGEFDCTAEGNIDSCNKYEVAGYPTLMVFPNGEKSTVYTGSRKLGDMINFVEAKLGIEICTGATKEFCNEEELAFIEDMEKRGKKEVDSLLLEVVARQTEAVKEYNKILRELSNRITNAQLRLDVHLNRTKRTRDILGRVHFSY